MLYGSQQTWERKEMLRPKVFDRLINIYILRLKKSCKSNYQTKEMWLWHAVVCEKYNDQENLGVFNNPQEAVRMQYYVLGANDSENGAWRNRL